METKPEHEHNPAQQEGETKKNTAPDTDVNRKNTAPTPEQMDLRGTDLDDTEKNTSMATES